MNNILLLPFTLTGSLSVEAIELPFPKLQVKLCLKIKVDA